MSNALRSPSLLWPRAVSPGATIGLVSPSGPSTPESIAHAVEALTARSYAVVVGEHAADNAETHGLPYLAGTDAARLSDLNRFLSDPAIDLILCLRGGYGAARILDGLDYAAARRDPKPLVGYSDVTALSLALAEKAGIVSFSGIMATAGHGFGEPTLDPFSEASFWQAVGDTGFPRRLASPEDAAPWTIHRAPESGTALSGRLYPVCLSLLVSLIGTPYVPDMRGAILVIEDVHEELYAVDRMLTQLRLAGQLDELAAISIGSFNGTDEDEDARLAIGVPRLCLDLAPPSVAVVSGIAYGHIRRRLTLPFGAECTVELNEGVFAFAG